MCIERKRANILYNFAYFIFFVTSEGSFLLINVFANLPNRSLCIELIRFSNFYYLTNLNRQLHFR